MHLYSCKLTCIDFIQNETKFNYRNAVLKGHKGRLFMDSLTFFIWSNFVRMTTLSASQWISSNISLTGFSVGNAAFMSCKELLENAIDATREVTEPRIDLNIDVNGSEVEITCTDNGRGFAAESVDAIHTLFCSSKTGSGSMFGTGKFGIGLKAMVLMSTQECGGKDVCIYSQAKVAVVAFNIGCSPAGDVQIKSFEVLPDDDQEMCGVTTITVFAPCVDIDLLFKNLSVYVAELGVFLPTLSVFVQVGDSMSCRVVPNVKIPKSVVYTLGKFVCMFTLTNTRTSSRVEIVRFVNGVPLVTSGGECSLLSPIVSSVRKMAPSLGIGGISATPIVETIVSFVLDFSELPNGSSWQSLTVRVNFNCPSDQVEYTSLTKAALVLPTTDVVNRAVRLGIKQMQKKFPTQFQSIQVWEEHKAVSVYIPQIAHNMMEMLYRSGKSDMATESGLIESLVELMRK